MLEKCSLERFRVLSGSVLKLIAVITMFIDHSAYVFCYEFPEMTELLGKFMGQNITLYYIMRRIGRLAFPIYCFLIGEGLRHTKNQKLYLLRLLVFALISEIPFNLMVSDDFFTRANQNVFFTLFLGALSIYVYENIKNNLIKGGLMLAILIVTVHLKADYGAAGVVVILLIYRLKNYPIVQALAGYPLFSGGFSAMAAFIPINLYNGQRGFIKNRIWQYAFYLFYPLHMLLLVTAKQLLR